MRAAMRIYTKTGDAGETGLFGNVRVSKADSRVEAYGSVDELNAYLGLLRSQDPTDERDTELREIQATLFDLGADLATPGATASLKRVQTGIEAMEGWIDRDNADLPALKSFILPGGHPEAAHYHVARTVGRRAERRVWSLIQRENVPDLLGTYLNRLSDLLFIWARQANHRRGQVDVLWERHEPTE